MQSDYICNTEHLAKVCPAVIMFRGYSRPPCDENGHAELSGNLFNTVAKHSVANDAEGHAGQLSDWILEHAKFIRLLPFTVPYNFRVPADVVREIQKHGKDMLYY